MDGQGKGVSPAVTVGEGLRLARVFRRMTLTRASLELGVAPATLSKYERGVLDVPPEVLAAAVRLYGRLPWMAEALEQHPVVRLYLDLRAA